MKEIVGSGHGEEEGNSGAARPAGQDAGAARSRRRGLVEILGEEADSEVVSVRL